jgi:hypothetical protein
VAEAPIGISFHWRRNGVMDDDDNVSFDMDDEIDIYIIREEKDQIIAATSKTRLDVLEPSTGEALGAFHAARLSLELGLQNFILEENDKQIVEAINSSTSMWSCYGHLVDDTRRLLHTLPM